MTREQRNEVKELIREVLKEELLSRFINPQSIDPIKIKGVLQNGGEPPNGSPLIYDAGTKTVRF